MPENAEHANSAAPLRHTPDGAVLQLRSASKIYGNTIALRDVDFSVVPGRIHGLAGANGAGKSTLIKAIAGVLPLSEGRIIWQGDEVDWHGPRAAADAGIAAMHQHVPLVGTLSVIENVFLHQRGIRRTGPSLYTAYEGLCASLGMWVDPDVLTEELPVGMAHIVGLLQALANKPTLLILDEPTASLGQPERVALFHAVRELRDRGGAIVYVSHFLDELLRLTDELTVLRDGRVVRTGPTSEFDAAALASAITGDAEAKAERNPPAARSDRKRDDGIAPDAAPVELELHGLSVPGLLDDVSFAVRGGEIVGIAGLLGSGRSELLHAIAGAERHGGDVLLNGRPLPRSIRGAIDAGVALVPEARMRQGLLRDWTITHNVCLPLVHETSFAHLLADEARMRRRAEAAIDLLSIKANSADTVVSSLSGGNQQKVLFGRWVGRRSKVMLLDEPTAGIDVGTKAFISLLIRQWADDGAAVLVVDSEFKELLTLADRILVLRDGRIVLDEPSDALEERDLILAANGFEVGSRSVSR